MEEDIYQTETPVSATWQQYYPLPQDVPYGFQFNENQAMANALRGYNQDPYLTPVTYMPGYEDTLTRKLLDKKDANLTTTQPYQKGGGMQMPNMNMNMLSGLTGSGQQGSATGLFGGPAPEATGTMGSYGDYAMANGVPASEASTGGLNWGGVQGNASAPVGSYAQTSDPGWFGNGGKLGGGWASAAGGALAGYNQGAQNYRDDPNMWNQKDGFGTQHKDYRAELGGGVLGGVMGYYGGPVGAALAGPTVKAVHPFAEKTTRGLINFGDKWGGATGASIMDPVGTMASGKYKWGEIFQVPFTKKLFGW